MGRKQLFQSSAYVNMQHGDMAEIAPTEKLCLTNFGKKPVRYGSMAKESSMKREKYLKHTVQPGDTLQGLALKYGVTMEQIKRANKMWTSDSLFLYSTLDIPVISEPLTVSSMSLSSETLPEFSASENEFSADDNSSKVTDFSNHLNIASPNESDLMSCELTKDEESAADFLIRIDSRIAQTKDQVLKFQKKIVYSEDDLHNCRGGLPYSGYQCRRNSFGGSASLSDLTSDLSVPPQTVVMTKGRKVKSSLKKLERQQDEIFEL